VTLTNLVSRNSYEGSGIAGPFPYTFRIFAATDLLVVRVDTDGLENVLSYPTHFTVSDVGEEGGGELTLTSVLIVGETLSIRRVRPLTQETDLRNQGAFFPEIHEDAFDHQTMLAQQLKNDLRAAAHLAESIDPDDFDTTLPPNLVFGDAIVVRGDGAGFSQAAMSAAQLSAWSATQNVSQDAFTDGVDFTAGVTTELTLSEPPGNELNVFVIRRTSGVDILYMSDEYSLSGVTLTFAAPIPAGTTRVEVRYLYTYQVNRVLSQNIVGQVLASQVDYAHDGTGAVTRTLEARLREELFAGDFGVVGDGVADDTDAVNLAATAGETLNAVVRFGRKCVLLTGPVTFGGPGFIFDEVSYGEEGDVGFACEAGAYTAVTVTGAPTHLVGTVYGVGGARPTVNLIYLSNIQRVTHVALRAYNADGFGIKIDKIWDPIVQLFAAEDCGNATHYAFSMNDGGDTCNSAHILRLQVEGANKKAIFISSNSITLSVDSIHSEGAIPDVAHVTWTLGGGSCSYRQGRFAAISNPGNAKLWLRGQHATYDTIRAEDVAVDLEGENGTSITLIEPNFTGVVREYPDQSGQLIILGGNAAEIAANWTGPTDRRFFIGSTDYQEGEWVPALKFGGASTGMVYSVQEGFYTKVGKLVHITLNILLTSPGSSVGDATIEDLPFVAGQTAAAQLAFYANLSGVSSRTPICRIDASGTTIILAWNNVDGAPGQLQEAEFENGTHLIMSATYRMV